MLRNTSVLTIMDYPDWRGAWRPGSTLDSPVTWADPHASLGFSDSICQMKEMDQTIRALLVLRPHQVLCPTQVGSSLCGMGFSLMWLRLGLGYALWVGEGIAPSTQAPESRGLQPTEEKCDRGSLLALGPGEQDSSVTRPSSCSVKLGQTSRSWLLFSFVIWGFMTYITRSQRHKESDKNVNP